MQTVRSILCAWLAHECLREIPFDGVTNVSACFRKYTIADYERLADDYMRKQFGTSGSLPARLIEVVPAALLVC
jgi:hypothetical protein